MYFLNCTLSSMFHVVFTVQIQVANAALAEQEDVAPVQRRIEPRSADDSLSGVVRCLCFADTFLRDGVSLCWLSLRNECATLNCNNAASNKDFHIISITVTLCGVFPDPPGTHHGPTLWAGTNSGSVYAYALEVPGVGSGRACERGGAGESSVCVEAVLGKEIQLMHRAPVVSICVLDGRGKPLPDPYEASQDLAIAPDMTNAHSVLIASEEQLKVKTPLMYCILNSFVLSSLLKSLQLLCCLQFFFFFYIY